MRLPRLALDRTGPPPAPAPEVGGTATGPPPRVLAGLGLVVAAGALVLFGVVAATVTRTAGRDRWDVAVRHALGRHAGGVPQALAGVGDELSAPAVLVVVTVLAALALWRWARRPLLGVGVVAVAVSTAALVQLLALAFSGVRPASRTVLGLPVFDGSFPSVRTAEGEALWGALVLVAVLLAHRGTTRLGWLAVGLVVSLVIAWGRLDRSRAWPTDVLGGWLLGLGAVGVAAALLVTWPSQPVVPGPVVADRVGGPATTGAARADARGTTLSR